MAAPKVASSALIVSLTCLAFSAGCWLFVIPQAQSVNQQRAQLEGINNALTALVSSSKSTTLPNKVLADKQQALTLLPVQDNQYDLAVQIDALSTSLHIPLTSLNIVPVVQGAATAGGSGPVIPGNLQAITLNIGLTASYADAQRFVAGLVSLDRYIEITQLSLSTSNPTSSTSGATVAPTQASSENTVQISAYAFYLPHS